MNTKRNERLTPNAQKLRREMTKEEKHLWYDFLRDATLQVKRQKVIGRYIVDFYVPQANLVIELDGSQHGDKEQQEVDAIREQYLEAQGIRVLRYTNAEIHLRFQDVCQDIWNCMMENAPDS